MKIITTTIFLALIPIGILGQSDGNPHHWDRRRRCDQIDYDPPCGICEGYGGIPTGDENDQIKLTTCVAAPDQPSDPSTLIKPVWGPDFFSSNYNEILIGPKTDPFCFQTFPSNSSKGELCYRHDSGSQSYYMSAGPGKGGLYEDLTLDSAFGKIQSTIIHQDQNFWIINKFPWYAFGVHQCICARAREGGDQKKAAIFPVQYNWTQQMFYVGREVIGIEYMNENMTLDHWAFGPHHVWSKPEDGQAVRMWQPFNGLQVFPEGTGNASKLDKSLFDSKNIPPPLCKKGGATFRIKCDDDGYSTDPANSHEDAKEKLKNVPKDTSTETDFKRAKKIIPGKDYRGSSFEDMSHTLNKFLAVQANVKSCDAWDAKELQKLAAMLYILRDQNLDDVYQMSNDNRRIRASLETLQKDWSDLNNKIETHDDQDHLHEITRDGLCHETVMWYVHHLSEDVRAVLRETGVEIPLLSYEHHGNHCESEIAQNDDTHRSVCDAYEERVTCASCHSGVWPSRTT